jgi:hypothetical protein
MRAPWLSSCTVALKVRIWSRVKTKPFATALVTAIRDIVAQSAMERAVYSDSIVPVAIVDCNLDTQRTGQPATSMM